MPTQMPVPGQGQGPLIPQGNIPGGPSGMPDIAKLISMAMMGFGMGADPRQAPNIAQFFIAQKQAEQEQAYRQQLLKQKEDILRYERELEKQRLEEQKRHNKEVEQYYKGQLKKKDKWQVQMEEESNIDKIISELGLDPDADLQTLTSDIMDYATQNKIKVTRPGIRRYFKGIHERKILDNRVFEKKKPDGSVDYFIIEEKDGKTTPKKIFSVKDPESLEGKMKTYRHINKKIEEALETGDAEQFAFYSAARESFLEELKGEKDKDYKTFQKIDDIMNAHRIQLETLKAELGFRQGDEIDPDSPEGKAYFKGKAELTKRTNELIKKSGGIKLLGKAQPPKVKEFKTAEEVREAFKNGEISKHKAIRILIEQFGFEE
jgi:hypothetical protein